MTVINRNRRQFLVGTGSFMLALPFMRSLLPRTAEAQAFTPKPRFVAWATPHGAAWGQHMFPGDSMLTESTNLYSDHRIRHGRLALSVNGGRASLSPVLTASSSLLTDGLAAKLNVLRGFDVTCNLFHHTGGYLGNYARSDTPPPVQEVPTIDQVMAYSPSFYGDLAGVRKRSMHVGHVCSYGYSNPESKSGSIQPVPTSFSSKSLFDDIFVPPSDESNPRVPVVDRVLESYRRLRSGAFGDARRLSAADRQRLDDHLARLAELERRVNVTASCGSVEAPSRSVDKDNSPGYFSGIYNAGNPEAAGDFYQVFNDVIVAAFMCGTSRIAAILTAETWSTFAGDWHQDVAHMAEQQDGAKQGVIYNSYQQFFERAFLDLAAKLDVEEADGRTYLDNTLMMWTQESGPNTHDAVSMPVVTAGSAAGFLKTGMYIDYRNRERDVMAKYNHVWSNELRPGILYSQWLATALQAMGVPPSEFERNGQRGYGEQYMGSNHAWVRSGNGNDAWPDRLRADASKIVPLLKA